jgi:hypothetical protein
LHLNFQFDRLHLFWESSYDKFCNGFGDSIFYHTLDHLAHKGFIPINEVRTKLSDNRQKKYKQLIPQQRDSTAFFKNVK